MNKTPAPPNELIKDCNFKLLLDNKFNNPEFIIEINLLSGKINFQAINNIGNNILNYESSYDFDAFIKIDEYFKFCKDINKIYDFIIRLKNNKSISLIKENEDIFLSLQINQPIENKINIPLIKSGINNKSVILLLDEKNSEIIKLKEEIKNLKAKLENKIETNNDLLRMRLMKRDIRGYSQNLIFIEKEIEKQLKKNIICYELLYKAKRDGDKSEIFHSKCDNKQNTLIIIKSNTNKIFGGFTTQLWNHSGYVNDPLAFVFSIDKQKIYNIIDNKNGENAIYGHNSYGPCFGEGTDFGLYSGCLGRNDNWCCNQKTYDFKNDKINGISQFQVLDYEVYQVILD